MLPAEYQIPQAMHAAMEFSQQFREECKSWHSKSNSVIVLAAKDDRELWLFSEKLRKEGLTFSEFREPDIGNELTAIAVVPNDRVKKLCSNLPLAGRKCHPEAGNLLRRKFDAVDAMLECHQTAGQNMLQHGESVRDRLFDLLEVTKGHQTKFEWILPEWWLAEAPKLLPLLPDVYTLEQYTTWHDCGKPRCRTVDEEGKVRYPGHAEASSELFRELYPGRECVARLIESDMDFHLLKFDGVKAFSSKPEAATLLFSALAEIHSNMEMFGGSESISFKIKWKAFRRLAQYVVKALTSQK
jgi:hypothetical protein